jgi:hypothetical protein
MANKHCVNRRFAETPLNLPMPSGLRWSRIHVRLSIASTAAQVLARSLA